MSLPTSSSFSARTFHVLALTPCDMVIGAPTYLGPEAPQKPSSPLLIKPFKKYVVLKSSSLGLSDQNSGQKVPES